MAMHVGHISSRIWTTKTICFLIFAILATLFAALLPLLLFRFAKLCILTMYSVLLYMVRVFSMMTLCSAPYSIECIRSFVVVISLHRTNSPILYRHIQYKTIHNIQSRKPHSFPIYSSLREQYFPRILIFSHLFEAGCFFVHSLPTI